MLFDIACIYEEGNSVRETGSLPADIFYLESDFTCSGLGLAVGRLKAVVMLFYCACEAFERRCSIPGRPQMCMRGNLIIYINSCLTSVASVL